MKIGICDDELYIVEALVKMVKISLEKINEHAEIIRYTSPRRLLEEITQLQMVFLDIEMPELDGFEVGRVIYTKNPACKIIMATGNIDRFKEAFKINVFRFITKPFQQDEVDDVMNGLLELSFGQDYLELYLNRVQYNVRQRDIMYFRAYNSYVEAMTVERCYRRDLSLNAIEEVLDKRLFFRINKQYVINLSFVTRYENHNIYISDEILTVARRRRKEFIDFFCNRKN